MQPASRFDSVQLSLIRQINALAKPGSINLGIGEPNLEPDQRFRELTTEAALKMPLGYSAIPGALSLRQQLAQSYSPSIDPESEICVTAGSQEGLWALFQAFIGAGDEVLVPDPGFVAYPALATLAGANPVAYPLDPADWSIDLEALEKRLTPRTKMIVVNSPSNPTGCAIPDDQIDPLVSLAERHGVILASDEVYREIYYGTKRPGTFAGRSNNVVVLSSVSKSHGLTGLRLGWILASAELMATIRKAHHYTTTCASTYAQTLVELILADSAWNQAWLDSAREQFREQRTAAMQAVTKGFGHSIEPEPDAGFYIFAPVPSCRTLEVTKKLATDHGVLVIPGVAFGDHGEGYLRISYASRIETLREGISRLSAGLEQLLEN